MCIYTYIRVYVCKSSVLCICEILMIMLHMCSNNLNFRRVVYVLTYVRICIFNIQMYVCTCILACNVHKFAMYFKLSGELLN